MTAAAQASPTERYRRERPPVAPECGAELERITGEIDDPVLKLRYLQNALSEEGDRSALVQLVPIAPARRAWYRLKGLQALDAVADDATVASRALAARKTARRVVVGTAAAGMLFVPVLVAVIAWQMGKWTSAEPATMAAAVGSSTQANATAVTSTTASLDIQPTVTQDLQSARQSPDPVHQSPVAEPLAAEDLGIVPSMVWLADRGPDWELYSNGLRIETKYTVKGTPRDYRVHSRNGQLSPTRHSRPIGILFHTSESDLWPLEPDYEKEVRKGSEALLRFV
jgi:hypothetical protein